MFRKLSVARALVVFVLSLLFVPSVLAQVFRNPSESVYYIPQFANGGVYPLYITSRLSVTNLTGDKINAWVTFYKDDGTPWSVPFTCLQNGTLSGTMSSRGLSLDGKESYTLTTPGTGELGIGWAQVQSNGPLLVTASYTVFKIQAVATGQAPSVLGPPPQAEDVPIWSAGVTPAPCGTQMSLNPVMGPETVMYGITANAGIAIANPSSHDIVITGQFFDASGNPGFSQQINLKAKGHIAAYASELFDAHPTNLMQATIRLTCNTSFTAMALQASSGNGVDLNGATNVAVDSASARAILYDTELNDDVTHAQYLVTPAEVHGTVVGATGLGDADYYRFFLEPNKTVYITVLAESIGSPLEPGVWVEKSDGTFLTVGTSLFSGNGDTVAQYTAPPEGQSLYIRVSSKGGSYGKESFYQMHVMVR